jgi:hypothetical protein
MPKPNLLKRVGRNTLKVGVGSLILFSSHRTPVYGQQKLDGVHNSKSKTTIVKSQPNTKIKTKKMFSKNNESNKLNNSTVLTLPKKVRKFTLSKKYDEVPQRSTYNLKKYNVRKNQKKSSGNKK